MLGVMMLWVMKLLLARVTSSPSMIVGMGVFRRVWRWWTRGVARTTLGDVASIDVVASPTTLGGWRVPTLGSWRFSRIVVSWSMAFVCLHFSSEEVGTIDRMCSMRSAAAMMVRSSSERVGTLQCVG